MPSDLTWVLSLVCLLAYVHLCHHHSFDVISEHSLVCLISLGHIPVRVLCVYVYVHSCPLLLQNNSIWSYLVAFTCVSLCAHFRFMCFFSWGYILVRVCMYGCALLFAKWFHLNWCRCIRLFVFCAHSFCVSLFLWPHPSVCVCVPLISHYYSFDVISEQSLVCPNSEGHIPVWVFMLVCVCVCESLVLSFCTVIYPMSVGCISFCISFPRVTSLC